MAGGDLTRRRLLGAGAAAAAGTGLAALGLPAPAPAANEPPCTGPTPGVAKAPPGGRIDLHAHHVPPVYREALLKAGIVTIGGYPTPVWTPDRAMSFVSLSDPGVSFHRARQRAGAAPERGPAPRRSRRRHDCARPPHAHARQTGLASRPSAS